ncbi:MAG: hypothetical protein NFW16_00550 [Candidatus Accumulibacter sp.]|uniref:hypothetical protein n=1 Tax=Accumulibacter sp. TaxID=2053492 RepID=UPI002588EA17|nr:hypothetical protein [Accumulibacter sp.]MCM8620242.1 hypothetical protein [Accumulibacter sp.]
MATPELLLSWKCTQAYLLEARACFSQSVEAEYREDLLQFEEYIRHNELGLAFEILDAIADESQSESMRVVELLALAAASMRIEVAQQRLDSKVSALRGGPYKTVLPPSKP